MGALRLVDTQGGAYVWRHERSEVRLTRENDAWHVVYSSVGRLMGPRQVIYASSHLEAKMAAWDVMARVIRASRDEAAGLAAGQSAAQWMRAHGLLAESDG